MLEVIRLLKKYGIASVCCDLHNDQPFLLSVKSDIHHVSVEFPNTSWTHCITKAIPNYDHPFTMLCVLD